MGLPTGTVTLLMADVERSVRLWEADREAMRAAMKALEEFADEAIEAHRGVRPVEQGEGDNLVVAFVRASDAVACAVAVQLAIGCEAPTSRERPCLRVGIHTGEVELRDEGRYDGAAVNRCARLRDAGHGGQILVSRTTHDLVADRLPDGVTLTRLGAYRLRDMARPEEAYQVDHPELASMFPPLRTFGGPPNNLPRQLTSFIGRESEMAAVTEILSEARLVTLTGSGGCGKTRLGIQVASRLLDDHPDGVWWVDLARVSDETLVPAAVAATMGVTEQPGRPIADTVRGHLVTSQALVVLDNCEHLIESCAELAGGLVASCPDVRVIATSREPLGVLGEVAWRVPSLEVPQQGAASLESLSQCEAVRLFIDRAVNARPNFQVTNDNAPSVAEICHRLDGIPLAIELAASRTRMMTPEQIVAGLSDRFRLLTGGGRGVLPRHQTLRASVEWSYDLLEDTERTMLDRLSVFRGSFTLDAAEDVCSGDGLERIQVLDLLADLVDRSLVQVEEDALETRFRLLETIRQYADERLAEGREAVRGRHLDHYVALAERVQPKLEGPDPRTWLERLDRELSNLRAAMDHGQASGQAEKVLRIVAATWKYALIRGHIDEGRRRIERATGEVDPLVRARALVGVCVVAMLQYNPEWALTYAQEALTLAHEAGDERTVGRALAALGISHGFRASASAVKTIDEAIDVCTRTGDTAFLCGALHARYQQHIAEGEVRLARRTADEIVSLCRGEGLMHELAMFLGTLGWACYAEGDLEASEVAYAEASEIARDLGNLPWQDWCAASLALCAWTRGDHEAAAVLDELVSRSRVTGSLAPAYLGYKSDADLDRGMLASAEAHADELLAVTRLIGWDLAAAEALARKADVHLARGDIEGASALVDEALALERRHPGRSATFSLRPTQGALLRARGEHAGAEDAWHDVLRWLMQGGAHVHAASALEALAGLAGLSESDEEAARLFGAGEAHRERTGIARRTSEQPGYEADVALVRGRLSEEDLERAWQEGRAMSLEEAAAYAARGRGERKRPSAGWASLTPTELEVVKLVAEGLTNPQIAERQFVARSTVKAHLSSIFRKLGVSTRSELATEATRRGVGVSG